MKKRDLIKVLFISILSFGILSCEKDEDVSDPEGTISLKMRNADNGSTGIKFGNDKFYISKENNFRGYHGYISVADVGEVKGLSSIKNVPNSGWARDVSVDPGHGYVVKSDKEYMRIYVESWIKGADSGGIIGANVKYQSPWIP
ncbi:MAG: DUF5036 family protein [Prevotella sp.]|nr:DUF5036 family protein [Prevotella sp.]